MEAIFGGSLATIGSNEPLGTEMRPVNAIVGEEKSYSLKFNLGRERSRLLIALKDLMRSKGMRRRGSYVQMN
jgi:hypothetical protein